MFEYCSSNFGKCKFIPVDKSIYYVIYLLENGLLSNSNVDLINGKFHVLLNNNKDLSFEINDRYCLIIENNDILMCYPHNYVPVMYKFDLDFVSKEQIKKYTDFGLVINNVNDLIESMCNVSIEYTDEDHDKYREEQNNLDYESLYNEPEDYYSYKINDYDY